MRQFRWPSIPKVHSPLVVITTKGASKLTAPACHEVCRLGQGCFKPTPAIAADPKENLSSSGGSENKIRQIPGTTVTASGNSTGNTAPHDSSDHGDSLTGSLANTGSEPVEDYIYQLKIYRSTNPKNCIIGHLNK